MSTQQTTPARVETADILKAAAALGVLGGGAQAGRRLLAMLCNPKITSAEIAAAIDSEPGLAARVLRVANSAFYGLTRKVSTIDRALMLLGLNAVRGIAAAACLDRAVPQGKDAPQIDVASLLRHSVAVAAAASEVARLRKPELASEAFIAGLLHDYGVLVQLRVDPSGLHEFSKQLQLRPESPASVVEALQVKVTHDHCAAVIFEEWKLPANLVAAARHHHHPDDAPQAYAEIAALVHIADHLGRSSDMGFVYEPASEPPSVAALALLGITGEDLEAIGAELPDRVQALQQSLNGA
ncbi:MAG: HDOD domain-containing protein [Steroidobacteraceae bacterium]